MSRPKLAVAPRNAVVIALAALTATGGTAYLVSREQHTAQARQTAPSPGHITAETTRLVTGKTITPDGDHVAAGSFPVQMATTPDGKWALVSTLGARSVLSVFRTSDGKMASQLAFEGRTNTVPAKTQSLYYGLAFGATGADGSVTVYASRGAEERVSVLTLAADGTLTDTNKPLAYAPPSAAAEVTAPLTPAGLALSPDAKTLYVANSWADPKNDMVGIVRAVSTDAGTATDITVPGYPYAVALSTKGPTAGKKLYVTSEQRACVSVIDTDTKKETKRIATGANPLALAFNKAQTALYVANAGSDTVSIVDTATDRVTGSVLLRPAVNRNLPGATPTALCLSPDEKTLYVTLADMNAVAVVDVTSKTVKGYIPTGWYPTGVALANKGASLLVSCAKGVVARNPNGKPKPGVTARPQYIQNIIEGTVSVVVIPDVQTLKARTAQVLANNQAPLLARREPFKNPGIEHVIYIIKENRTYDQVLGDLPQGNGDPSLVLFGREVTPNLHALAERFVLLDNFYCCAEVSGDGWNWSTAGMANEYVARNVPYGYTGKTRPYDYEGTNNSVAVDKKGIPDVARPAGGYLWDNALAKKVTIRNYGFFMDDDEAPRETAEEGSEGARAVADQKALANVTNNDFAPFNTSFPDGEAFLKRGVAPAPRQIKAYGSRKDPSRFTTWKRDFDGFVQTGKMPRFQMLRLGRDHTAGTSAGQSSPRAMVADNDYAVGQVVEAVSKSKFWAKTAIFIVEDDAQNGYDHVDAHRSIAFVISPFIRKATKDSRFYNTDSVLRTIENILGLPPMNQYDAIAPSLAVFTAQAENNAPYDPILPARAIIGEVNGRTAYRSRDSARLLNPLKEESAPDEELNDILWHAVKGNVPNPPKRYGILGKVKDED